MGNIRDASVFDPEGSCEAMELVRRDADGDVIPEPGCGFLCPSEPPPVQLCWQSNVIAWNQADSVGAGQSEVFGSRRIASNFEVLDEDGELRHRGGLAITLGGEENFMIADPYAPPGTVRDRLFGLPAIGFWAARFVNGNARPGILASYALLIPHVWNQEHGRVAVSAEGVVIPLE